MNRLKIKGNLKKIFVSLISFSMMFTLAAPNFASAMKETLLIPIGILYDVRTGDVQAFNGIILDKNDEDPYWQLEEGKILATISVDGNFVSSEKLPFGFFYIEPRESTSEKTRKQLIGYTEALISWLKENANRIFTQYSSFQQINIEVTAKLIGGQEEKTHSMKRMLVSIIIRGKN